MLFGSAAEVLRMFDQTILMLMLTCNSGAIGPVPITTSVAIIAATQQQPNTKMARPLGRLPTGQDIARLQSVEGKPRWVVLLVLGHPSFVERRADGFEVWDYPWFAACRLWIKNGVCTGTFYTAGF